MFDLRRERIAAVDAQEVLVVWFWREQRAGGDADMLLGGLLKQVERVDAFREFDPQKESAPWLRDLRAFGKVFADRFVHQAQLLRVALADFPEMIVVTAVLQKFSDRELRQDRRRARVRKLQPLDFVLESAGHAPADAETGRERLRNG